MQSDEDILRDQQREYERNKRADLDPSLIGKPPADETVEQKLQRLEVEVRYLRRLKACFKRDKHAHCWFAPDNVLESVKVDPKTLRDAKRPKEADPVDVARAQADHFLTAYRGVSGILYSILATVNTPISVTRATMERFSQANHGMTVDSREQGLVTVFSLVPVGADGTEP